LPACIVFLFFVVGGAHPTGLGPDGAAVTSGGPVAGYRKTLS